MRPVADNYIRSISGMPKALPTRAGQPNLTLRAPSFPRKRESIAFGIPNDPCIQGQTIPNDGSCLRCGPLDSCFRWNDGLRNFKCDSATAPGAFTPALPPLVLVPLRFGGVPRLLGRLLPGRLPCAASPHAGPGSRNPVPVLFRFEGVSRPPGKARPYTQDDCKVTEKHCPLVLSLSKDGPEESADGSTSSPPTDSPRLCNRPAPTRPGS